MNTEAFVTNALGQLDIVPLIYMFSYLYSSVTVGFALVLTVYGAVSERERLLLDTTIWIVISGFIPVRDHSLQGLRTSGRELLVSCCSMMVTGKLHLYLPCCVFSFKYSWL